MFSYYRLSAVAAVLATASALDLGVPGPWGDTDPSVNIINTSGSDICYKVEFSAGNFPTTTTCDSSPGFVVQAGQTVALHTGAGFNGALTAITNTGKGGRYEINFSNAGVTWYDTDYQLGMSDGTLGPADHQPLLGTSQSSLSGEQDCLGKANAAWPSTQNQNDLLANPGYIQQNSNGQLSYVYMDANAPEVVAEFFQLTADFTAYIGPGSIAGVAVAPNTIQSQMTKAADDKSWQVGTQAMEIIAY